jgi:hypothetical protein
MVVLGHWSVLFPVGAATLLRSLSIILTPLLDWRTETADFYSTPEDAHFSSSHEGAPRAIPFCTATCRSEWLN